MKKLQGRKVKHDIHYFTNRDKAHDFGELMSTAGFIASYKTDGNLIAVTLKTVEEKRHETI